MKSKKCLVVLFFFIILCSSCASSKSKKREAPNVNITGPTMCMSTQKTDGVFVARDLTNAFSPYDDGAIAFLSFEDFSGSHTIRWQWYNPNGKIYAISENWPLSVSKGKYVKKAVAWHTLTIRDDPASSLPGEWKVEVYIDDKIHNSTGFFIKHRSDVVPPAPKTPIKSSPNDWGVIIGIQNYLNLPKAEYANGDALVMEEYFKTFFGIPEENIKKFIDNAATDSNIKDVITNYLPANVKPDSTVYIYFSGHGYTDIESRNAFLVPYDGKKQKNSIIGYKVDDLLNDVKKSPRKS